MAKASKAVPRWPNHGILPRDARSAGQQAGRRPAERPRADRSCSQAAPRQSPNFASAACQTDPWFSQGAGSFVPDGRSEGREEKCSLRQRWLRMAWVTSLRPMVPTSVGADPPSRKRPLAGHPRAPCGYGGGAVLENARRTPAHRSAVWRRSSSPTGAWGNNRGAG
jgi:hypothetical protein